MKDQDFQTTLAERSGDGFVFAATGADHAEMACCAVRSLRKAMPDAQVDLFTDREIDDPAFDRIVQVERSWHRPKMESLRRSRFARTIHLDSDVIVLADLSELFTVLRSYEIIGVQMPRTNWGMSLRTHGGNVPSSFPQINSGVIGASANERTQKLITDWEDAMISTCAKFDQPILRELLWRSAPKIWVLPLQYNMMSLSVLRHWDSSYAAPRILHPGGRLKPGKGYTPGKPYDLPTVIGSRMARHVERLIGADNTLGGNETSDVRALSSGPSPTRMLRTIRRRVGMIIKPSVGKES